MRLRQICLTLLMGCSLLATTSISAPAYAQNLSEGSVRKLSKSCLNSRSVKKAIRACEKLMQAGFDSFDTNYRAAELYQKRGGAKDKANERRALELAETQARNETQRRKVGLMKSNSEEEKFAKRKNSSSTFKIASKLDRNKCVKFAATLPAAALPACDKYLASNPDDVEVVKARGIASAKINPQAPKPIVATAPAQKVAPAKPVQKVAKAPTKKPSVRIKQTPTPVETKQAPPKKTKKKTVAKAAPKPQPDNSQQLEQIKKQIERQKQADRERARQERIAREKREAELLARLEASENERKKADALRLRLQEQLESQKKKAAQSTGNPELDSLFKELRAQKRYALLIGNSDYPEAIGALDNPVNDATDMAKALEPLCFEVTLLTNAKRGLMRDTIRKFYSKVRPDDLVLFFYAGHGVSIDGENFMLPVNAVIDDSADILDSSIRLSLVINRSARTGSSSAIIVLDACRNNPFISMQDDGERGWSNPKTGIGTFIAYGTDVGQIAEDGSGRNGVYTKHILQHIAKPRNRIEDVFNAVRSGVHKETKGVQTPAVYTTMNKKIYFSLK